MLLLDSRFPPRRSRSQRNVCDLAVNYAALILSWFCNGCWQAWEEERREKRLNTGKLLPEDRELWYSDIIQPLKVVDFDDNLSFKLSLFEQYRSTSEWFSVDIFSLTVETFLPDSPSSSSFVSSLDERPKQTAACEASWYKSLDWRQCLDDEFSFDFSNVSLVIGSPKFPILSLREMPAVLFSHRIVSPSFIRFRAVAREARAHRCKLRSIEDQRKREQEEVKRKQLAEIQQKQKDLVQLALKRAQTVQSKKPPAPSPPPKSTNVWSSAAATAVARPPQTASPNTWSSRPMVPPAMPVWSAAGLMPLIIPQPGAVDPWSSANVWAEPAAKRAKTPPDHPQDASKSSSTQ